MKKSDLRLCYAFIQGAKWWEYHSTKFTMWQSDQNLAWTQAVKLLNNHVLGVSDYNESDKKENHNRRKE